MEAKKQKFRETVLTTFGDLDGKIFATIFLKRCALNFKPSELAQGIYPREKNTAGAAKKASGSRVFWKHFNYFYELHIFIKTKDKKAYRINFQKFLPTSLYIQETVHPDTFRTICKSLFCRGKLKFYKDGKETLVYLESHIQALKHYAEEKPENFMLFLDHAVQSILTQYSYLQIDQTKIPKKKVKFPSHVLIDEKRKCTPFIPDF
jgi:hypothetical protein